MTQASEPLVVFTPSGRRGRFAVGTTVLDAARALGVDIDSVCGGRGLCGRCQVHRQVVRKELTARDLEIDPVLRLHLVEVESPALASPTGDLARLLIALDREWGLTDLVADLGVIQGLHATLEKGGHRVTVAVHGGAASSPHGPASARRSTAWRSTSAPRRSPGTWRTSRTGASSPLMA